jgi:Short C-terminal domain
MPLRRMGRPGLIGMAARTAVVAGTATAVAGGVRGHQEAKANQAYEAQQYEAQQQQAQMDAAAANAVAQQQAAMGVAAQQAAAAPAAPAAGTDIVAELQKLAALHDQGILSDDEFAGAKAKLLG